MPEQKDTADIDLSTVDFNAIPSMSSSERALVLKAIRHRASEVRDFANGFLSQLDLAESQLDATERSMNHRTPTEAHRP